MDGYPLEQSGQPWPARNPCARKTLYLEVSSAGLHLSLLNCLAKSGYLSPAQGQGNIIVASIQYDDAESFAGSIRARFDPVHLKDVRVRLTPGKRGDRGIPLDQFLRDIDVDWFRALLLDKKMFSDFQPILRLGDRSLFGHEGLLRDGKHSPFRLFKIAHDQNAEIELDLVAIETHLENASYFVPHGRIFINVYVATLLDARFSRLLLDKLEELKIDPVRIVLELVEADRLEDLVALQARKSELERAGVQFALDDIGQGSERLSYLARLHPQMIKIDRRLIEGIGMDRTLQEEVGGICRLAKSFEISVVAEGMQNEDDSSCVTALGVEFGQSFFLGKPSRRPDFEVI